MSSEWGLFTLGDIARSDIGGLVDGPFGSNLPSSAYVPKGIPVIRGSNLTKGTERFKANDFVYVSSELANKLSRSLCQPNDIIFTKKGTLGQIGIVPEIPYKKYLLSSNQMRLRVDETKAVPDFVYYCLSQKESIEKIIRDSEHTGVPKINLAYLKSFPIFLPDLVVQRTIVSVLSALDDRITLLRETNKTLESIAQAIFKSWFMDFDPVRAKMEGHQPEGMDEETAELFPDSFEESELGLIPRGWRAGFLSDLSILNPESWTAKNHPEKLLYADLANTKDNVISELSEFTFEDAPSRARRVLRSGDTIVGTVRPGNRSFAFIYSGLENLTGSTGFAVLRPRADTAAEFVYLSATQDSSIEYLTHVADGGAYPAVRPDVVSRMACALPSEEILKKFHDTAMVLFHAAANNQMRAETLVELRDTLLPRLISGRLRLPEAQGITEAALS